jgi:hypothetical protein
VNYWGTDTGPSVGMNLAEEKGLTRVQTLGMRRLRSERSGGTQSGPPLGLFVLYHKCVSRLKPSCGGWARCAEPGFPNTADECARPPGSASAFRCCAAIWDAAAVAIDPNRNFTNQAVRRRSVQPNIDPASTSRRRTSAGTSPEIAAVGLPVRPTCHRTPTLMRRVSPKPSKC